MVRRCCVADCKESDVTILAHRFPIKLDVANKWRSALDLHNLTIDDLQKKYVVCTKHFSNAAYRNEISNCLNTTATPNLDENSTNLRVFTKEPNCKKIKEDTAQSCNVVVQQRMLALTKKTLQSNVFFSNNCLKKRKLEASPEIEQGIDEVTYEEHLVAVGSSNDDQPEMFEAYTIDDEEIIIEDDDEEVEEAENEIIKEQIKLQPPQLQLEEIQITYCTRETQTDHPTEEMSTKEPAVAQPQGSKDDKIIKILYPEYEGMSKIQLIELVSEKNQKLEAMEQKIKKLEEAMRSLL